MRRKRPPEKPAAATPEFGFQPFRQLKGKIAPRPAAPPPPPVNPKPPPPPVEDPATLFEQEMKGVRRFEEHERARVELPTPAAEPRAITSPDAEALAELCDLVSGVGTFDLTDSDEYVEGSIQGTDPRLVRRLRRGEFAYQAHIDLHRLTRDEARIAIDRFLTDAIQAGKRCVLIIHGRGLNSKDQIPVLKGFVTSWLSRSQWSRQVLAFASARPCDGGVGALYVLLRRKREARQPFLVSSGKR